MNFKGQLNFGANLGFDRRWCTGCKEERLHRYGVCVSPSCATVSQTVKQKAWAPHRGALNTHQRKLAGYR